MTCSTTALRSTTAPGSSRRQPSRWVRLTACTARPVPVRSSEAAPSADDAFVDFVRTNTRALMRTAYPLAGSTQAAEELVQDTLVALYPQWDKAQRADVPLAYVRRSLTNRFLNQQRRAAREILTDTVPDLATERSAINDLVDRDEMWALLKTLSGRQRAAIVLRYYEGLSDADIAADLGVRPATVRSLISRGLATLRQYVNAA